MLSASVDGDLRPRGEFIVERLRQSGAFDATLIDSTARCGGGTMPKAEIPSLALELRPRHLSVARMALLLRQCELPVMGYIAEDSYRIDLRTVFPTQDAHLLGNLLAIL
jgi:L-seryl-tRNA(Ser) seleniumtransferase